MSEPQSPDGTGQGEDAALDACSWGGWLDGMAGALVRAHTEQLQFSLDVRSSIDLLAKLAPRSMRVTIVSR